MFKATNTIVGKANFQIAVVCSPEVIPAGKICLEESGLRKVEMA